MVLLHLLLAKEGKMVLKSPGSRHIEETPLKADSLDLALKRAVVSRQRRSGGVA
jgi:hypothetical protein